MLLLLNKDFLNLQSSRRKVTLNVLKHQSTFSCFLINLTVFFQTEKIIRIFQKKFKSKVNLFQTVYILDML